MNSAIENIVSYDPNFSGLVLGCRGWKSTSLFEENFIHYFLNRLPIFVLEVLISVQRRQNLREPFIIKPCRNR